ncbi:glycosyltransferase family 2 protein [Massilia horti]|nr:glycosyltransferase family 2 protein [Massilia horti]
MNQLLRKSLSIIVPAYDAAAFIEPCLRSILAQLEPQHALVVIDDGSRDATGEIAEHLQHEFAHARFTIVRQPNHGVATARNQGLAAADGEYVLFVDADDLLEPGALLALDRAIATHRPDVVACDYNTWRQRKKKHKCKRMMLGYPPNALLHDQEAILCSFFAGRQNYVWANVFRREIYERVRQPVFPPGRVFEDVAVVARLLAECASLFHLSRPIIDYRQHPSSLKCQVSSKWCVDFVWALRQIRDSFVALPVSDAVRMHIDVAACHFYVGIVKTSYQLPWREGRVVRAQVRQLFLDSLFNHPLAVLAAMERGTVISRDHEFDLTAASQARKALSGSVAFGIMKSASRRWKMWQQRLAAAT